MMPLLVVLLVGGLVFLYMRANKAAKTKWLNTLDLPGHWNLQDGDGSLALAGNLDGGSYVLRESDREERGDWRVLGSTLLLEVNGIQRKLDLHLFRAGQLGVEDDSGQRKIYFKESSNVVPLQRK